MKKLIVLIIILVLLFSPLSFAQEDADKYEEYYKIANEAILKAEQAQEQADEWRKLYEKEREDKLKWKQLYKDTKKDLEISNQSNENLQDMVDRLDKLLKDELKSGGLSFTTGVVYTPNEPKDSGILFGFNYGM